MQEYIYIDKEFIINEYEKNHKRSPIKYSKTTRTDVGMDFVAKVGGSLIESFEYELRPYQMLEKCITNLKDLPVCDKLDDIHQHKFQDIFWFEGVLGTGKSKKTRNGEVLSSYKSFEIWQEGCSCDKQLKLVFNNSYFISGYNSLYENPSVSIFTIKAKMLLKVLGYDVDTEKYILAPLVIQKTGYYFRDKNNT
ncbi:MAG: hypothetical protein JXQ76_11640 [Campylobacterales bacterium]|nr:hypothetical protein [Campylobacterales bacterium]